MVPGSLFAAFRGERADGHDHAMAAVESGAAARARGRPSLDPFRCAPSPSHRHSLPLSI
ncbi:Mur ligase domain-containing protein [Spongiactinospora rosea]|uniref:Mur ligase domain-containing protein n=1 Tax=Spongiactinospora rosea TaxID=2248750 RepID=UPI0018F4CD17